MLRARLYTNKIIEIKVFGGDRSKCKRLHIPNKVNTQSKRDTKALQQIIRSNVRAMTAVKTDLHDAI